MKLPNYLTLDERQAIEQAVRDLVAKHSSQIRLIALFGSKARGDFEPESDIDLLIISDDDDWQTRFEIRDPVYDSGFDHGLYISPRVIGWERFKNLPLTRPGFFANLRRDAIELWRRPDADNPLQLPEPALAN